MAALEVGKKSGHAGRLGEACSSAPLTETSPFGSSPRLLNLILGYKKSFSQCFLALTFSATFFTAMSRRFGNSDSEGALSLASFFEISLIATLAGDVG